MGSRPGYDFLLAELRHLLAPIDTTNDVELLAGCGRMLKTPDGWELTKLYTDKGDCWGGTSGWQRYFVSLDGVVTLRDDHVLSRAPTCISGRRPDGLVAVAREGGESGSVAGYFMESACSRAFRARSRRSSSSPASRIRSLR